MQHGYEPSRLTNLTQRSRWAVGALDGINSTDPAAVEAMSAVAGLKSVIANGFIPATTVVGVVDPLGGSTVAASSLAGPDWYGDWLHSIVETGYSDMSDDELFAELERLEDFLPYDDDLQPDMDDPFWDDFEQLAIELAVRAETDESFADRLADEAVDTFLIPIALEFARFDPELVADMLLTVSEWPSWSVDLQSNYRNHGAELLITFLADLPVIALDVLADPDADRGDGIGLLEDLLLWPGLDPAAVTRFIDVAMSVPFDHPELIAQAGAVLRQLVEIANGTSFPDGFPPALSPTLAKIAIQYLPFFVTSLDEDGDIQLKDFDFEDIGVNLGDREEFVDFFGALLRDPTSMEILLGVIPTLTLLGHDAGNPLHPTLDDVANYLQALRNAAENEQLEEELEAARDREIAGITIDLVFVAIDLITSVTGPLKVAGIAVPIELIKGGVELFADWAITATDLGLDAIATTAYFLMVFGLGVAIVRNRDHDEDDDETAENVLRAEAKIAQIETALEQGASFDDVQGLIGDLRRLITAIDGDTAEILDDDRVEPPEFEVTEHVDSEN